MAGKSSVVKVLIVGDAKSAVDAFAETDAAAGKLDGSFGKLGATWFKIGAAATTAVVGGFAASAMAFTNFDKALTGSLSVFDDLDDAMRHRMSDAARQLARTTAFSAGEAANAFRDLGSTGFTAEQAIGALPVVANFAAAGLFDLATATDLSTDAQAALGLLVPDVEQNLKNLTRVTDVFIAADNKASGSARQFAEAMTNKVGAALRVANKSIEEGTAALMAFADRGVKGAEAGEALAIILRDVPRAAAKYSDRWAEVGVSVFDAAGNLKHIASVIDELNPVLADMSDAERATTLQWLGLTRSVGDNLKILTGAGDEIRANEAYLLSMGGVAQQVADKQLASFGAQISIIKNRFIDLGLAIGERMMPLMERALALFIKHVMPVLEQKVADLNVLLDKLPGVFDATVDAITRFAAAYKVAGDEANTAQIDGPLERAAGALRSIVDAVKGHEDILLPVAAGVAALATATVALSTGIYSLGLLGSLAKPLTMILPALANPIGLVVLGLTGLGVAAYIAYQKIGPFREAVDRVFAVFKESGFKAAVDEAGVQFGRLWELAKPKLEEFRDKAAAWLVEHGPVILDGLKNAWVGFATWMTTEFWPFMVEQLGNLTAKIGEWVRDTAAPWLRDKLVEEWGPAFSTWVEESAWPWIRDELPKLVEKIGKWVIEEGRPKLQEKLIEWADAFVDWIQEEAIPKLEEKLPGILAAVFDWVVNTALPEFTRFALNMGLAIAKLGVYAAIALPGQLGLLSLAFARWAYDLMVEIPKAMAKVGYAIARAFLNPIIDGWNGLKFTTPQVEVFGVKTPAVTIRTPQIPRLAAGGIATGPMLAMIGEGGRDEAIVPLPRDWRHGGGGLGLGLGSGPVYNVVINVPPGTNARSVGREFRRYLRESDRAGIR